MLDSNQCLLDLFLDNISKNISFTLLFNGKAIKLNCTLCLLSLIVLYNKIKNAQHAYFLCDTFKSIPPRSTSVTEWLSNSNSSFFKHSNSYFCRSIIKPIFVTIFPIRKPKNKIINLNQMNQYT